MTRGCHILERGLWQGRLVSCMIALLASQSVAPCEGASNEAGSGLFRLGFSTATFTDVNENDALAGIKVWARKLLQERGLPVDPAPVILNGADAIAKALREKRIEAITLNVDEYWRIDRGLFAEPFIGGLNEGRITEEYVLLVHRDSQIERLEQLRDGGIALFQNTRMALAPAWLDVVLLKAGLPQASKFCRISGASKLTKVVLPVFFRQAEACVVTRRGFKTMAELNPQVGQRLKVLASSPELVPTGFVFRNDYTDPLKDKIQTELAIIKDSPAGAQVLTLFQSGSLEAHPLSCLDSAVELLELHHRLCGATNSATAHAAKAMLNLTNGVK